jgi:hypothetical protein
MIKLPALMLGDDLPRIIRIVTEITDDFSDVVQCDASELLTAEPVALCLLAAAFAQLRRREQRAVILGLRPQVRRNLERLDVLAKWFRNSAQTDEHLDEREDPPPAQACRVSTLHEANAIANALSIAIASFVPHDDLHAVIQEDPELTRYRAVQQPLGYLMTELLDNALNHGRAHGRSHASAWVAAQYYPAGDLVRVCVVDDGCGFLGSLRYHPGVSPKTDVNAIAAAFRPFVSCKKDVGLFKDAVHQGIGLTVCRDLCMLAEGRVDAASGTAWTRNAGAPDESVQRLSPGYEGSIVNLAFRRRAITPGSLGEVLRRYQPNEDLPIRFI